MGLFTKKKQDQSQSNGGDLPELPDFPDMHDQSMHEDVLEFPSYEPTISDIKNEVDKEDDFEVPQRERPVQQNTRPSMQKNMDDEKPLFVQIDKYKDVLRSIEVLKAKLANAEDLLKGLDELKTKEEQKIEEWKQDVQNMKERLLSIDQELFEV
ncbi:hypothetical protein J4476_05460 [Candidatus Woesearchaeota archaeon]|nr:MAG: hypothetical protein QT09_C0001G0003 [archaeon GW2011_AR18]MBS3162112.1 hypothetical protein [Candidatus Woesearchaeota archaeon]HIH25258.1 hypothetical protein [Nanoarchaeota archaeon]